VSDIDHPDPLNRESNAPGGPPTPGAASLLDVRAVAAQLGLSSKAVRGLIMRGELPAYKVAGRLRVDIAELADYLAATRFCLSDHDVGPAHRPAPAPIAAQRAQQRRSEPDPSVDRVAERLGLDPPAAPTIA
jgi:excisionase family DNA binding protein